MWVLVVTVQQMFHSKLFRQIFNHHNIPVTLMVTSHWSLVLNKLVVTQNLGRTYYTNLEIDLWMAGAKHFWLLRRILPAINIITHTIYIYSPLLTPIYLLRQLQFQKILSALSQFSVDKTHPRLTWGAHHHFTTVPQSLQSLKWTLHQLLYSCIPMTIFSLYSSCF